MQSPDDPKPSLPLTNTQILEMVQIIMQKMAHLDYVPDHIVAIGRGGIIPAALIAYHYGLKTGTEPTVSVIYAASYKGQERGELKVQWPDLAHLATLNDESTLIVDDIEDSGATLRAFNERLPHALIATLITKKDPGDTMTNFYGYLDTERAFFYDFPWEITE